MRSKLQMLYDRLYYGFEIAYNVFFLRLSTWKSFLGKKFDKAFHDAYKNSIVPYWAKFGIKPRKSMVKYNYMISGGDLDPRYIPEDVWAKDVIPFFNDTRFAKPLADKNLNSLIFPQAKRPETLFKCMSGRYCLEDFTPISREDAVRLCQTEGRWFIKPTMDSFQGRNVRSFYGSDDPQEIEKILAVYGSADHIVQRAIVQHPALSAFNASSINTIRLFTAVFREEAHVLSACLRVGVPGSIVDNLGAGGYQINIQPDGTVSTVAGTKRSGKYERVDLSGNPAFQNAVIPNFQTICDTAKEMALHIPHLHLIAWDFALDQDGDPVLIEFNARSPGQSQETCGPTFMDLTDEILSEIFAGRKDKTCHKI